MKLSSYGWKEYLELKSRKNGDPITLFFTRNVTPNTVTDKNLFRQNIEPTGLYVCGSLNKPFAHDNATTWITGLVTFNHPFLIESESTIEWKESLKEQFKAKKNALRLKMMKQGYDGIVTFNKSGVSECVIF